MINKIDFSIIDSELKAYLTGLFYADAHLTDYCIMVRMSIKDKVFVDKLANIFDKEIKIRDIKNKNGKTYKSAGFNICSKNMVNDFRNIGFIKNKTYQNDDIVFNNIPDNLKRHFIRGYFDGDGTIFFSKWKRNINWNESDRASIGFISYNKTLLESIMLYLSKELNIDSNKTIKSDKFEDEAKNEKYWRLIYNGNKVSKLILDFLYINSTIHMNRKYDEYLKIKVFEPKGYHFNKKENKWRVPYENEYGIKKWKNFKSEIEAKTFVTKIKNDPTFISKIKDYEPKGYYKTCIVEYKKESKIKHKVFKNEIEAQDFIDLMKDKLEYIKNTFYTYWRVPYKDKNGKTKTKNFKSEIEAKEFLNKQK